MSFTHLPTDAKLGTHTHKSVWIQSHVKECSLGRVCDTNRCWNDHTVEEAVMQERILQDSTEDAVRYRGMSGLGA